MQEISLKTAWLGCNGQCVHTRGVFVQQIQPETGVLCECYAKRTERLLFNKASLELGGLSACGFVPGERKANRRNGKQTNQKPDMPKAEQAERQASRGRQVDREMLMGKAVNFSEGKASEGQTEGGSHEIRPPFGCKKLFNMI